MKGLSNKFRLTSGKRICCYTTCIAQLLSVSVQNKTARLTTGSFNFTNGTEEHNAENLLIIDSPELARLYREEWERHRGHGERW